MTKKQRSETRRWLNRYRYIVKEIEARKKELEWFTNDLYHPLHAVLLDGMPRGTTASDPTFAAVVTAGKMRKKYDALMAGMLERIEELESTRRQILGAIEELDETERCVCYHRFVLGIYWADLPAYLNYEQRQCQNIENRALEKIFHKYVKSANECQL